jgi:hypothetical protein
MVFIEESFKVIKEYSKGGRRWVSVCCEEGHIHEIRRDAFSTGMKSCKHCKKFYYKTPEYNTLDSIYERCTNPNTAKYEIYGERGISVCERWCVEPRYKAVKNFIEDVGHRPSDNHSIERIDVNGNYEPSNCKWELPSVQGFNQNTRCTNSSGRTGVYFDLQKEKWVARITKDRKGYYLGYFTNFEDAVKVREEAELKYYGFTKG